ncbi:MAG: MurR/RpiR family transcriptional regulator [Lawsonibacter sp.]|nr:MurR/RpiR family transcriptional regulator [Lawsonibacter sp.]
MIGSRSAYGLAYYFGCSLSWIRREVMVVGGGQDILGNCLSQITPEDAALAIGFPPYPLQTLRLLSAAHQREAITIAITDSFRSPLAQNARYCLPVATEFTTFANNAAPTLSLLTALVSLAGAVQPERTAASLEQLGQFWRECNIYSSGKTGKILTNHVRRGPQ